MIVILEKNQIETKNKKTNPMGKIIKYGMITALLPFVVNNPIQWIFGVVYYYTYLCEEIFVFLAYACFLALHSGHIYFEMQKYEEKTGKTIKSKIKKNYILAVIIMCIPIFLTFGIDLILFNNTIWGILDSLYNFYKRNPYYSYSFFGLELASLILHIVVFVFYLRHCRLVCRYSVYLGIKERK